MDTYCPHSCRGLICHEFRDDYIDVILIDDRHTLARYLSEHEADLKEQLDRTRPNSENLLPQVQVKVKVCHE